MKVKFYIIFLFFIKTGSIFSQKAVNLNNLETFKNPSKNWEIVGNVQGIFDKTSLTTNSGTGILHCKPHIDGVKSENIFLNFDHGDINISFDFMMPKSSNSGVYLQGRYEIQLFDSWGVKIPKVHDCGAIYERWDDARGKGKEGFEGHPPRQNSSFAPGLWQHMEINFLAPKFDATGKKIANAKFVKVLHNGFLIHENIELSGPTRAGMAENEVPLGPLMIQGDHGEVAFKNLKYELLNKQLAQLQDVSYKYYEGKFDSIPENMPTKITSQGKLEKLNYRVAEKNSGFLIDFNAKINLPETDKYTYYLPTSGHAILKIDGKKIIDTKGHKWRNEENKYALNLEKGIHSIELIYSKTFSWGGRALGLLVQREGTPMQPLHDYISLPDPDPVGLIEVKANPTKPVLQRSFVYFDGKKRTHAINIGLPNGINASYDLNRAALLHAWRGKFLNATEMWYERGEPQITEPMAASIQLNGKNPIFIRVNSSSAIPDSLSVENEWVYKGYTLDENKNPVFKYSFSNETVTDKIVSAANGAGLLRSFTFSNYLANSFIRAGESKSITKGENGIYQLDNHYIRIDPYLNPIVEEANGIKVLLIPITSRNISYSIIW
jgi:hypothetical protein